MCGRYLVKRKTIQKIADSLGLPFNDEFQEGEYNPGSYSFMIGSGPSVVQAKWGYTNPYGPRPIINARSETASMKPLFHDDFLSNRCVVPADIYYEWTTDKKKVGFYLNDRSFLMGALFKRTDNGNEMVILTKEASDDIKHIHPRSPVIIPYKNLSAWLSDENAATKIIQLQNPIFQNDLEIY